MFMFHWSWSWKSGEVTRPSVCVTVWHVFTAVARGVSLSVSQSDPASQVSVDQVFCAAIPL